MATPNLLVKKQQQVISPDMFITTQDYNAALRKVGQGQAVTPTATPAPGIPLNASQQARLASQKAQLSGKMSNTQALQARDQATGNALKASTTINRYTPQAPEQQQAQMDINKKYGLATDTGLKGADQSSILNMLQRTKTLQPDRTVPTPENPAVLVSPRGGNQITGNVPSIIQSNNLKNGNNNSLAASEENLGGNSMISGGMSGMQTESNNSFGAQNSGAFGGLNLEDYMNMGPEEQLMAQAKAQQQYGQQQMGFLDQIGQAQAGIIDKNQQQAQSDLEAQKSDLEAQNQEDLSSFKADQQAQLAQATGQIEQAGQQRQEQADLSLAFQGFGRSTKAADIRDNIRQDTAAQIADINRQSLNAVNEHQASLLDRTNTRIDKLQERVDRYGDAKDQLALDQVKAQGDLMMDLFKQNPLNPENMIKTAEKLKTARMEEQKMAMEERKEMQKSARENFQFMVGNFGSSYLQNLDPESLQNLASNLGISPQALASVGPTLKEVDSQWEKVKYVQDFSYRQQNDETNRIWQAAMSDRGFQQDLEKLGIQQDFDMGKMYLGQQLKDAESQKKYANLGYGNYAAGAQPFSGGLPPVSSNQPTTNSNSLAFGQPIKHPFAKADDVVAMNPALVNAYPPGYKKQAGPSGLGGQCAYEARMIANIEPLGNTPASKLAKLKQYISNGKGFMRGQGTPQPGDVLVSNASKQYGHAAIVNARCANGDIILSEFNYAKPLTFSNTRRISATSPEVVGFIRAGLKPQYQVKPDDVKKFAGQAASGALSQNPILNVLGKIAGKNSTLGAIGGALAGAGANALNGGQTRSDLGQIGGVTADMFTSPQQLASFVQQNGVADLQNQDFWKNSPYKQQAWSLLQNGQSMSGSTPSQMPQGQSSGFKLPFQDSLGAIANGFMGGSGQQSPQMPSQSPQGQQMPQMGGNVDEQGMQLTPDRQMLRSGTMPDFQAQDIYKQLNEGYQATGDPQLKQALNQFMTDYQYGKQNATSKTDFTQSNQLYNRYDSLSKEIRTLDQGLAITKNFNINTQNPYDDQALIFSFMKVLDPGSVVREGEFTTAQKNSSLLNSFGAQWQNALNGTGMLLPEQRKKILTSMTNLYQQKRNGYEPLLQQAASVGQQFGIDPKSYLDYQPGQFNSQPSSGMQSGGNSKIQQAVQQGYQPQEILQYLQSDPQYSSAVQQAVSQGYSPEEIIQFLNQ